MVKMKTTTPTQQQQLINEGYSQVGSTNENEQQSQHPLQGMPTLPTLPRGSTSVPGVVNFSQPNLAGSGGGGSGGSSSSSSTTTISSTTTNSTGIPSIPAYHALGAARHVQPVVNPNNVSVDKRAHDKYAKKFVRSVPLCWRTTLAVVVVF